MASLEDASLVQIHDSFMWRWTRWALDHRQHVVMSVFLSRGAAQMEAGEVARQPLLILCSSSSPRPASGVARIAGDLEAIGFETEPFARERFAVKAAPSDLNAFAIDKVCSRFSRLRKGRCAASPMDFRRAMLIHSCQAASRSI